MTTVQWEDGQVLTAGSLRLIPQFYTYETPDLVANIASGTSFTDIGSVFVSGGQFTEFILMDCNLNYADIRSRSTRETRYFVSGAGLGGGSAAILPWLRRQLAAYWQVQKKMVVNSATFISDTVKYIRDVLRSNITDPISASRPSNSGFVMTSYPRKEVVYPIVTIVLRDMSSVPLGQGSESEKLDGGIEIRVWGRDVVERDTISEEIIDYLRDNKLTVTTGSADNEIHDLTCRSATQVDDPGEEGPRSMVMNYTFFTILGG